MILAHVYVNGLLSIVNLNFFLINLFKALTFCWGHLNNLIHWRSLYYHWSFVYTSNLHGLIFQTKTQPLWTRSMHWNAMIHDSCVYVKLELAERLSNDETLFYRSSKHKTQKPLDDDQTTESEHAHWANSRPQLIVILSHVHSLGQTRRKVIFISCTRTCPRVWPHAQSSSVNGLVGQRFNLDESWTPSQPAAHTTPCKSGRIKQSGVQFL